MQFALALNQLVDPLAGAAAVTDRRNDHLSSVLVTAEDGRARLAASNMIVSVVEYVEADVSKVGRLATHGSRLHRIARTLPPGQLTIRTEKGSKWTEVNAGRTTVRLLSTPAEDYPELPEARDSELVEADPEVLRSLLGRVLPTVCADESRPNLSGALLLSDGKTVTMVSTDGHRLTKCEAKLAGPNLDGRGAIVPRSGVAALAGLLSHAAGCSWGVARGCVFVRVGNRTMAVRLNDKVTFPPWRDVLPKGHLGLAVVSREDLQVALRQAVVFAPKATSTTKLVLSADEIELSAESQELGSARLSVDAKYEGVSTTMGINGAYLLEALEVVTTEQVTIAVQCELDPLVISPEEASDILVVLMPMRI